MKWIRLEEDGGLMDSHWSEDQREFEAFVNTIPKGSRSRGAVIRLAREAGYTVTIRRENDGEYVFFSSASRPFPESAGQIRPASYNPDEHPVSGGPMAHLFGE